MQQKENLLSTQKGKIIAISGGLVGVVVIYLLLALAIGIWPFKKLTKNDINAMVIDPGTVDSSIKQTEAATKVKTASDTYDKLKKAADKLNVNKDDVATTLTSLKTKIDSITSKSKAESFDAGQFVTEYTKLTKVDYQKVADEIIKAADLK